MVRERSNRRREQEKSVGSLLPYEKANILEKKRKQQNKTCFYCKISLGVNSGELDHILPVSRGGSNEPENFVVACLQCNREKHNKTPDEYKKWMQKVGCIPKF